MKTIKMVGLLAGLFLSVGILLVAILPNQEKANFNYTIEMLLQSEDFSSQEEVLESYPELALIQQQMDSLHSLEHRLRIQTQSPVPFSSQKEEEALLAQMRKCSQVRLSIDSSLQSFLSKTVAISHLELQGINPIVWEYFAQAGWKMIIGR